MRKTTNLVIREGSKKSPQPTPEVTSYTSFKSKPAREAKRAPGSEQLDIQKEMVRAENLSEREQEEIQNEARRQVTKKLRQTETKI
jgi:hypothetical protein